MKFGEIFWGEVKIDALKGWEGGASKKETIILFSRCQIVKATSGNFQLHYLSDLPF